MRNFNEMSPITMCFASKTSPLIKIDVDRNISYYNSENETYDLETFATEYDTKSLYIMGLYSLDSHLIGLIGISFTEQEYKLTTNNWIFLRQKVGVIGTLLTDYLKIRK